MKLLSYQRQGVSSIGVIIGSNVLDLREAAKNNVGEAFMDITMDEVSDMISFLNMGEDGLQEFRKAIEGLDEQIESEHVSNSLISLEEVDVEAPIPHPTKGVVCLGLNYADHVAEGSKTLDEEQPLPEYPIFFTKAPTAINGPYDDIVYPRVTERLDYEVELAVVIGRESTSRKRMPTTISQATRCSTISPPGTSRRGTVSGSRGRAWTDSPPWDHTW
jgi:2-keto-4-pentenoate hydratase/2-oxohepta-3-ene-1,7-dioic acid hydratase in catechol pathway